MSNIKELLQTIGDRVGGSADARKVYGDPVTVGGRTVIPVAKVGFGFGAGAGGNKDTGDADSGGGGGGLRATPVGALEITDAGTRFIRFNEWTPLAIAAAAGFAAGLITGYFTRRRTP